MGEPEGKRDPENRRRDAEDDGRTIADMSGVERPGLFRPGRPDDAFRQNGSSPGRSSQERSVQSGFLRSGSPEERTDRPWEQPDVLTPQERRMYALGALKAALFIGLAFIVGLGAVILVMLLIWT